MILKSKDIKKYREKKLKEQNYIDPITKLKIQKQTLDHDHGTGKVRQVLDHNSNQFEGKVNSAYKRFLKHTGVSLKDILFNLISYLSENYLGNPIHPLEISLMIRRFSRSSLKTQEKLLSSLGVKGKHMSKSTKFKTSKKENTRLYRVHLMKPENIYKV